MKLSDLVKTIEFSIPNTDLVVLIKDDLSWFEYVESLKIEDNEMRGIYTLSKLITSWNLTDDTGSILPVNEANLKQLPSEIGLPLIGKANELIKQKQEKKTK